jgi:multiple sugar transport system substrate-binding protein
MRRGSRGKYEYPARPRHERPGEWYPYAFLPFLWSHGGSLVDREGYQTADGHLNGDAASPSGSGGRRCSPKATLGHEPVPADQERGFIDGKFAFQWNGNWRAVATMAEVDDVVFLPAPDFGEGNYIGGGSWQFGVSATCPNPEGANALIEFALQDEYLAAFSDGIGLIPATTARRR